MVREALNKRDIPKGIDVNFFGNVVTEFHITCNECGRVCLSRTDRKKGSNATQN